MCARLHPLLAQKSSDHRKPLRLHREQVQGSVQGLLYEGLQSPQSNQILRQLIFQDSVLKVRGRNPQVHNREGD